MAKRAHNSDELFELKWNNYSNSITEEIFNLKQDDLLVDLTFCCEGVTIGCHKLLIFACSPVLRAILTQNPSPHPIIYITDIKLPILQALLKYIYQGEVQISKSDLVSFMKAADSFQIRGLQSKRSLGEYSSSSADVKKRRTNPFETTPGPSGVGDPLTAMQHADHDSSNLDFVEFENECSFGGNDESVDDTRFSAGSSTNMVQQTLPKLKKFIKSMANGTEILNEYERNGALSDERREELSQLVAEFMAKGVVKGGRAGHEIISEAALILFPGVFEEDPKTLAESLYNRLGRQTQQRYGAESPEPQAMTCSYVVKYERSDDDDDFEELEKSCGYDFSNKKYAYAADQLRIPEIEQFLEQMGQELHLRSKIWNEAFYDPKANEAISIPETELHSLAVFDVDNGGSLFASVTCYLCKKAVRVGFNKFKTRTGIRCSFHKGNFNRHFRLNHKNFVLKNDEK